MGPMGWGGLTERCGVCPGSLMSQAKALSGAFWVLQQSPVDYRARSRRGSGRGNLYGVETEVAFHLEPAMLARAEVLEGSRCLR